MKAGPDTLALAFGILDRVLSVLKVRKRLLRVLAAASLSLAIKFSEDDPRNSFARYLCDVSLNVYKLRVVYMGV